MPILTEGIAAVNSQMVCEFNRRPFDKEVNIELTFTCLRVKWVQASRGVLGDSGSYLFTLHV